jgi:hypothetical protein
LLLHVGRLAIRWGEFEPAKTEVIPCMQKS